MNPYVLTNATWSTLGFVVGFIVGSLRVWYLTRRHGEQARMKIVSTRLSGLQVLAIVISLLAVGTVLQGAVIQANLKRQTECQTRYNQAFNEALQERAKIADSDRESIAKLVQDVLAARPGDRVAGRAALQRYLNAKEEGDKRRAENPLPTLPKGCND